MTTDDEVVGKVNERDGNILLLLLCLGGWSGKSDCFFVNKLSYR